MPKRTIDDAFPENDDDEDEDNDDDDEDDADDDVMSTLGYEYDPDLGAER